MSILVDSILDKKLNKNGCFGRKSCWQSYKKKDCINETVINTN